MSSQGRDRGSAATGSVPASSYEIGYGKPPAKHRFPKGTSGNPGGRPAGVKNKPRLLDPTNQPTDSLILEEAYRPVTIREGD